MIMHMRLVASWQGKEKLAMPGLWWLWLRNDIESTANRQKARAEPRGQLSRRYPYSYAGINSEHPNCEPSGKLIYFVQSKPS
jgi:hypothetical protein